MILEKVKNTIEKHSMLKKGDKVIIALSGGPDSVCLMDVLSRLKDEYGIRLYAAHLNHQIRGIEAQKDAMFCMKRCEEEGIMCFIKAYDVPAYSREKGLSIEEGARELRYGMFFELQKKLSADKIAVAHNLDDQAETLIMRMMRGTGLEGLKGMEYSRRDGIIRPLLDVTRAEIEAYISQRGLSFRLDSTNLEDIYTRNKIRLRLIPYMDDNFNVDMKKALSRMGSLLSDDAEYINSCAKTEFDRVCSMEGEVRIDTDALTALHNAISSRVVRMAIGAILGDIKGVQQVHIEYVIELARGGKEGSRIDISRGLMAIKENGRIVIKKNQAPDSNAEKMSFHYDLESEGSVRIEEIGVRVQTKIIDKGDSLHIERDRHTAYFDFDKVKGKLSITSRMEGDRIRPIGLGGTKKLKDLFIDLKIEREKRDYIPVLRDENGVMWVMGYRLSEAYRVDAHTKRLLKVTFTEL
ncbi:tRNA(Ile)-lysidine synthase TilS [Peptoclostridium acidaminophilum DSM 3953]|uniref:tRNA(Ile)-lysidine synthase n=1 Tax=Peptoclostridium acidaminophilum DSM 3953 TaxID=1286171 RepID=W8TGX0_PEPAC|nr:tRNA lysidine(34) synthetase TilS [Peptoclostridium acidaminophilum]AHM57088.1 tRNA(Ile)-lysidine synthase TilS [Peptoclostridium acidaminophilum DSM 3953]